MSKIFLIFMMILTSADLAWSKQVTVLFIGNSYTYLPDFGEPESPALPQMIQAIASTIDADLSIKYDFNTPGGYSFEKHLHDSKSLQLLSKKYDKVILQGQSIESLELTPWWEMNGNPGFRSFSLSLPKILDLISHANSEVTLYVNWGWSFRHPALAANHPGLIFPAESEKAGKKWCGENKNEFQDLIDQSYQKTTYGYPVKLSKVGRAWLQLQQSSIVNEDELYLEDDWSHPSQLGAFVAALLLVRDSLELDISKNKYFPTGIDPIKASEVQKFLIINKQ